MNPFLRDVAELTRLLGTLDSANVWKVFACCAERWFPVYRDFVEEFQWGDSSRYRDLLDALWAGASRSASADLISPACDLAPHADDFDNLKATLAQDACICLASAAEWNARGGQRTTKAIEFSLEGIKMLVCKEITGCLDLGDKEEDGNALDLIVADDRYRFEHQMILSSIENALHSVQRLKNDAIQDAWSFRKLRL